MNDTAKILQVASFSGSLKRFLRQDEPPFTLKHVVRMASYLANEVGTTDAATLSAALLIDCLVNTSIGAQSIESFLGSEIVSILEDASRLNPKMSVWTKAEEVDGAAAGVKAKLVTLVDLLVTVDDLQTDPPSEWPLARIQEVMTRVKGRADMLRDVHPVTASRLDALCARVPFQDIKRPNRYHWHEPAHAEMIRESIRRASEARHLPATGGCPIDS